MNRCCCQATDNHFSQKLAESERERYRKKGLLRTTRMLLGAIRRQDVRGISVLDIGGGFGAILHELQPEGIRQGVLVEMSSAYLRMAEEEAKQRGQTYSLAFVHADFLDVADELTNADLVTLDRVVCCYPEMHSLIGSAARKANRWIALSWPRERWFVRISLGFENQLRHLKGNAFRTYLHSESEIRELLNADGFDPVHEESSWTWRAALYARRPVS